MRITRRRTGTVLALAGLLAAAPFAAPREAAAQAVPGTDQAQEGASTLPPPPAGVRDPFIPLVNRADPAQQRPVLSGLRLAGLIWDPKVAEQIRALVETPEGLGYILRLNDQRFGGKVVAIGHDRLRFSVVDQTAPGDFRIRLLDLKLDGGEPAIVRTGASP